MSFYYKEQSTANERMFFVVGKHFPTSKQACYFVHARFKYHVYFCGFGYVLYFRFTILSPFDRPLFLGGVSCALGVNDYARFFTELGFFLYCYCCLSFSPSALSLFRFHFPRDNPFQLEFPLVDHLSMSSRTKSQEVNKNGGKESAERVFKLFCS